MPMQLSQPHLRDGRQAHGGLLSTLGVDGLAAYRITRLITADAVLARPRAEVLGLLRRRERSFLVYLLQCPWCLGVYVGIAVSLARQFVPGWGYAANALALAAVVGLLSELAS